MPGWRCLAFQISAGKTAAKKETAMSQIVNLRQMQIGQQGKIAAVEALGEMGRAFATWA